MTKQAALLGYHNAPAVHYTQGPSRWQGIDNHLRAWRGQYPNYADCSSYATWCLWQGLGHFHLDDIVNGADWRAGYTGTMLQHGRTVRGRLKVGDCVIYGQPGSTGAHVAIVVDSRARLVVSHGSEGGPYLIAYNYRGDIQSIRRYI